jgi:hypothetical protein
MRLMGGKIILGETKIIGSRKAKKSIFKAKCIENKSSPVVPY